MGTPEEDCFNYYLINHAAEMEDEYVNGRVNELMMCEEYNPNSARNLSFAVGELTSAQFELMAIYLNTLDYMEAMKVLTKASFMMCLNEAQTQAKKELESMKENSFGE